MQLGNGKYLVILPTMYLEKLDLRKYLKQLHAEIINFFKAYCGKANRTRGRHYWKDK